MASPSHNAKTVTLTASATAVVAMAPASNFTFVMHSTGAADTYITLDGSTPSVTAASVTAIGSYCLVGVAGKSITVAADPWPIPQSQFNPEETAQSISLYSTGTPTITIQSCIDSG
jgi:hypothetical protein